MNSTVQKMNSFMPVLGNALQTTTNTAVNAANSGYNAVANSAGWNKPLYWFVGFLVIFLILCAFYYEQFMESIQNWSDSLSMWITGKGTPIDPPSPPPTVMPSTPEDESSTPTTGMEKIVEKILPPAKDVFTVSKNEYTYYDAAPLCKALGAELATYDDVKHSWQKGADWCNYGWVKGQMAVYPTQNSTYEELQQGPADQRGACGKPGLNGGYFDNPELKFGVTCVGKKPTQSQHDATAVTSGATRPLTVSGLQFEKKVQQFKEESDSIGILPFNKNSWTS
jgi:hypothetical protein